MRALWSNTKALNLRANGDTQQPQAIPQQPNGNAELHSPLKLSQTQQPAYKLSGQRNRTQHSPAASISISTSNLNKARSRNPSHDLDEQDTQVLPFAASALDMQTPEASHGFPMSPVSATSSIGPSSIFGSGLRASASSSVGGDSSIHTPTKEDMVMDLLSSQAMLESKDFAVMSWDELEGVKREHALLTNKINALTHKLNLEIKMRDAASSLARSVALSPPSKISRSESSSRVDSSSTKIASTTADLANLQQREAELRTRLLRHMAAVLSLVLSRREDEERSFTEPFSPSRSTPTSRSATPAKFDGHHLFANNKHAITPRSPQLGQSTFSSPAHLERLADVEGELAHAQRMINEQAEEIQALRQQYTLADSRARQFEDGMIASKSRMSAKEEEGRKREEEFREVRRKEGEMLHWREEVLGVMARHRLGNSAAELDSSLGEMGRKVRGLESEVEKARADQLEAASNGALQEDLHALEEERQHLEQTLQDADAQIHDLESRIAATSTQSSTTQKELSAKIDELSNRETRTMKSLAEIWKALPSSEARLKVADSDDLKAFKACFTSSSRIPLGNFGLDLVNAPKFTTEEFVEKIRNMLADDKKLVDRLIQHEAQVDQQRTNVERSQRQLAESQQSMQRHQKQVAELEERIEVSSQQEVSMLERLNELSESVEQHRMEKRKADNTAQAASERVKQLESEQTKMRSSIDSLSAELAKAGDAEQLELQIKDLKDDLADAQEEIEQLKSRESKQRTALLDELNSLQQEASTLRMQLRKAERQRK